MADVTKTVDIIFGGKDLVSPIASNISSALGEIDTTVHKITAPLADFAEKLLKWEAALSAVVVGGLALAVKEAGDFGDQITEISTLTKGSAADIGKFGSDILAYARDSKKSIEDINGAINTAIRLGTNYQDSLGLIEKTEKLSIATRSDLMSATELVATSLNAYGMGIDQAAKYSDIFFTITKNGTATIPELVESLGKITGVAAGAGVPLETLGAAIMALTASGESASQAAMGLRSTIASIINPSESAQKAAKALGIEFSANALKSKGLAGVLGDVYAATGGSADKITDLFGSVRSLNAVFTLGADKSGLFAKALSEISSSAGSTQEAYTKMANNFAAINQNLANNLKSTLIEIGEPLLKAYGDTAKAIVGIFKGLDIGFDIGAFQPLYDAFNEFASKAITFMEGVAKALPEALKSLDFSPIIDSLRSFGSTIADFLNGLDLTKPKDLAIALQGVIDTIGSMIDITRGMAEQFKPLWDIIMDGIKRINQSDEGFKGIIGRVLTLSMEVEKFGLKVMPILNIFGDTVLRIFDYFSGVLNRIGGQFDIFVGLITADTEKISQGWHRAWDDEPIKKSGRTMHETADDIAEWWAVGSSKAAESVNNLSGSVDTASKSWLHYRDIGKLSLDNLTTNIQSKDTPAIVSSFKQIKNSAGELVKVWEDTSGVTHFEKIGDAAKEVKEKIDKIPESVKMELAFYEAQSKRISSLFEFKAKIETGQFELDMKTLETQSENIKAAFTSTTETIKDTSGSLAELFKLVIKPELLGSKLNFITKQIEIENKQREEMLDLQRNLTDAQIDQINAQTKLFILKAQKLQRGDPIIRVSAEGLKPHLEAILWDLLEAIQIRVNEEGADLLLGIA